MASASTPANCRQQLLNSLRGSPKSLQQAYASLFTYFGDAGIVNAAQNVIKRSSKPPQGLAIRDWQEVRGDKFLPAKLSPALGQRGSQQPANVAEVCDQLQQLLTYDEFEVQALRWLKRLDWDLAGLLPHDAQQKTTVLGLDGHPYWVCRTNNHLVSYLNAPELYPKDDGDALVPSFVTWAGSQSPSLRSYCRKCTLIPQREPPKFRLQPQSLASLRKGKSADTRLTSEWADHRCKVLLWPFTVPVQFNDQPQGTAFGLRNVVNEADVVADAIQAVKTAKEQRATFLLFPELSVSAAAELAIQQALKHHGSRDYPILTIGGRLMCTKHEDGGEVCVNEAFLLGPRGEDLGCHRKITSYEIPQLELREATTSHGNFVRVLETKLGNLGVLICLDLLHEELKSVMGEAAYANLLMVPSLSPTTSAHMNSADDLFLSSLASTFVCNHRLQHPSFVDTKPLHGNRLEDGASFWRVAHAKKDRRSLMHPPAVAYFCFDLEDFVEKAAQSS
jgi:hypothetical protein